MITREDLYKMIEKNSSSYVEHCRDNHHSVHGIAEAYCQADYLAGAQSIAPMLLKALDGMEKCQEQLELYNFAKDEIRIRMADDEIIKTLAEIESEVRGTR